MSSRTSFIVCYLLLIAVTLLRIVLYHPPSPLQEGKFISGVIRVESQTAFKDTYHSFRTTIEGREVRVVVDRYTSFDQGELLKISGTIKNVVLNNDQTLSSIYHPIITHVEDNSISYRVRSFIRDRVSESFSTFLPPDEAHLLNGIVFGVNSGFSSKLTQAFSNSGVMHVIAASGMNVTLLGGFVSSMLSIHLKRRTALILTIFTLIFYAFLAGFGASIVRATIMGCIAFGAGIYGRQNTAKLALLTSGLVMLIVSPGLLLEVGFQLSFAATAGIMWLKEYVPKIKGRIGELISEDLGSTLSAQVATFPIILFYFHSIGLISPIINILVLWIVPIVMVIGLVASVVALIAPIIGACISLIAWPFLAYFIVVVEKGSEISPVLTLDKFPGILIASYYLLLISLYLILSKNKTRHV